MESYRKNLKPSYKYLWLNVLILILNAFLLSTIYIGKKLADLMETETSILLVPLIILTLVLPVASILSIIFDNEKNKGDLPKFRIYSNRVFYLVAIIFEVLALILIFIKF